MDRADANWNLRTDLAHPLSFRHDATGYGVEVGGSISRRIREGLSVSGAIRYRKWRADNGINTLFAATGGVSGLRLNEVNWQSFSIRFDTAYTF